MGRRFLEQNESREDLRLAQAMRASGFKKDAYQDWVKRRQYGAGLR